MRGIGIAWFGLLWLAGCAGVQVTAKTVPDPDLPQPQITTRTSSWSGDLERSAPQMRRAAVAACGDRETVEVRGPYGIFDVRMMDFYCR